MKRWIALACLAMTLTACDGMYGIGAEDRSGKPTVYATVLKTPNPAFLGCFLRTRPSGLNRPNKYEYCMIKDGDKYAVYYYTHDGKKYRVYRGWSNFTIDGDTMISDVDAVKYFVKDGQVFVDPGSGIYPMRPFQ